MSNQPRIAVVTAAGGGIGSAIVQQFLVDGLIVVAVDIDQGALQSLNAQVVNKDQLHVVLGDMTNAEDVTRVYKKVEQLGALHILINGVGSSCSSNLRSLTLSGWRRLFDLNLTSAFLCTQAALPMLEATSGDRTIINISSTLATVADPTTLAYGAFKAALEQITRSLALELAPQGIRVLAIAPGPVAGTSSEVAYETDTFAKLNPLGRFATGAEIAALTAFLASPSAAYITGTIVRIDGGDAALGIGWGSLQKLLPAQRLGD